MPPLSPGGADLWRSLDELAGEPEFQRFLAAEFPQAATATRADRRSFVKLMAASLALGGLGGCSRPPETVVPYVTGPDKSMADEPLYFATAMPMAGYGFGLLVESRMGRPVKVEGNPLHPASRGGTDSFAEASVLGLWDPDRSQNLLQGGEMRDWSDLLGVLEQSQSRLAERRGAGLRILTGAQSSPTLNAQLDELLTRYPEARWHEHEPIGNENAAAASQQSFGEELAEHYDLDAADVIVSLDADFLGDGPARVRLAREFAARRDVDAGEPNRVYVVESSPSMTGAAADHRLALGGSRIARFAQRVAALVGIEGMTGAALPAREEAFAAAVAADLGQRRGRALVVVGRRQPPLVHRIGHALNAALGAVGTTLHFAAPPTRQPPDRDSLAALVAALQAGDVDLLIVSGTNPALTAPADLEFAGALMQAGTTIHHGLHVDETAELADWHVPDRHYLERWGDVRAFDGTASIIQPLIAPLYAGASLHMLLAALDGDSTTSDYDRVRAHWRGVLGEDGFESSWTRALHDGVIEGTAADLRALSPDPAALRQADEAAPPGEAATGGPGNALELGFYPDASVWDGRFANNGWLQELPRPLTTLTWDNAAILSPATASELGLVAGDVVELRIGTRRVDAPVIVLPGQADASVAVQLGYGRSAAGRIGSGVGFDAYALRTTDALWHNAAVEIRPTGRRHRLATTQNHHAMEARAPVRRTTLAEYRAEGALAGARDAAAGADDAPQPSLYAEQPPGAHAWGMSIDLNRCIGCNACTIACQAENNVPIVGREQVAAGREMHWIRIDQYFEGSPEAPRFHAQPVPCMHCEQAPCEIVCPVGATLHDSSGLNLQIYNRCVGTRFCSNNCPYKVRRFNFLDYAADTPATLAAQRNPEVTVRTGGVMEKCTYCVQRIKKGESAAELSGEPLADGDVVTACQAACPAEAIVFGDLSDPTSAVAGKKRSPRDYSLLEEQNTRPRTTYLAKVRNPNPELES